MSDRAKMLQDFNFDGDVLRVTLTDGLSAEVVTFRYVRSLLFYKESDFWEQIASYEREWLNRPDGSRSAVMRVLKRAIVEPVLSIGLREEEPIFFCVWTPDECLEVVSFEEPTISAAALV